MICLAWSESRSISRAIRARSAFFGFLRLMRSHVLRHISNVVDLVHAGFDGGLQLHALRYVAGHAHSPSVSFTGDLRDQLGLERAVDLDLGEAGVGIAPDQGQGLLGR